MPVILLGADLMELGLNVRAAMTEILDGEDVGERYEGGQRAYLLSEAQARHLVALALAGRTKLAEALDQRPLA